jgi:hypothetical protein
MGRIECCALGGNRPRLKRSPSLAFDLGTASPDFSPEKSGEAFDSLCIRNVIKKDLLAQVLFDWCTRWDEVGTVIVKDLLLGDAE